MIFEAQMHNNPTAMSEQLYSLDKLMMYNYSAFKAEYNIAYIDPAFGKKERGEPCYFSFIIGTIVENNIYIIEWHTNKNNPEDNEILIIEKIKEFNIQRFGVETNAQQSEFARNIQRKINENNIILNLEWINNTLNKDRRIQGMHGTVIKNVYFRSDWETTYRESMSQLTLYPYHKFKDAPDALAGLLYIANNWTPQYGDEHTISFELRKDYKE
jgi:predicted phage terminase large subunit-like protein